jgi:hypothetical protein
MGFYSKVLSGAILRRSLDVGRDESYALTDQLSEQEPVEMV